MILYSKTTLEFLAAFLLNNWNECKRLGATLIVAKVDRLTRDIEDGAHIYKNYSVQFCDHPDISPLELGIFLGMAQQEREFISQRTKQGMAKSTKQAGNPHLTIKKADGLALIERNHQLIKENKKSTSGQLNCKCQSIRRHQILGRNSS